MKRPSAVVVLVVAGVAGLIGLLAYGVASESPDTDVDGEPAPEIALPPLEGGPERSLDGLARAGRRPQLLGVVVRAVPGRVAAARALAQEDLEANATVLGVDVLDVTSDAQDFIDKYGLTYPHLRDKDGSTQEDFGIVAYPETFVIDRDGTDRRDPARARGRRVHA